MWTKNGENTLPHVLPQINLVIPEKNINQRLIIDDASVDKTRLISESYGWTVLNNEGSGISDGANTALKNVESDHFICFEQDLFLAHDWFRKIPILLSGKVAVASGVRLPTNKSLRAINNYAIEKSRNKPYLYSTLDNTICTTRIIREIGGFPKLKGSVGIDSALKKKLSEHGFYWKVNHDVKSIHLKSCLGELKTQYWYGSNSQEVAQVLKNRFFLMKSFLRLLFSPIRGLEITFNERCLEVLAVYPALRLANFLGALKCSR